MRTRAVHVASSYLMRETDSVEILVENNLSSRGWALPWDIQTRTEHRPGMEFWRSGLILPRTYTEVIDE